MEINGIDIENAYSDMYVAIRRIVEFWMKKGFYPVVDFDHEMCFIYQDHKDYLYWNTDGEIEEAKNNTMLHLVDGYMICDERTDEIEDILRILK